jgi:ABC-type transport system involved in cytochrome c biogenesis permease component
LALMMPPDSLTAAIAPGIVWVLLALFDENR